MRENSCCHKLLDRIMSCSTIHEANQTPTPQRSGLCPLAAKTAALHKYASAAITQEPTPHVDTPCNVTSITSNLNSSCTAVTTGPCDSSPTAPTLFHTYRAMHTKTVRGCVCCMLYNKTAISHGTRHERPSPLSLFSTRQGLGCQSNVAHAFCPEPECYTAHTDPLCTTDSLVDVPCLHTAGVPASAAKLPATRATQRHAAALRCSIRQAGLPAVRKKQGVD